VKTSTGTVTGILADQWKEIITVDSFDEHTVVTPGIRNAHIAEQILNADMKMMVHHGKLRD